MKKIVLLLVAIVAMVSMAEAQTVYIAQSNSAIAYHKTKDCSYLKNSVNVTSISTTKAKEMGRHACVRCYPEQKAQTMKNIEKQKATKKPATAKKATSTAKKATPERDEKGRFVKKSTTEKKAATTTKKATTAAKKTLPERDEKGRFVKKSTTDTKEVTKKKSTPARDEKGRFIKKSDAEKQTKTKKTTKKAA